MGNYSVMILFGALVFFSRIHTSYPKSIEAFQSGSESIKVETLTDSLMHLEFKHQRLDSQDTTSIYSTPMVGKFDYPGPKTYKKVDLRLETGEMALQVLQGTSCVEVNDLIRFQKLAQICVQNLDQDTKTIRILPNGLEHIYGVGNYFYDPNSADGDWSGRDWISAPHGNARYGFLGGAPTMSQFPVIYALGDDYRNLGIFVDTPYRISWNFRNPHEWTAQTWGDQIRLYLITGPHLKSLRRQFVELTGRPLVPPQDVFGLWISKFGYHSWNELWDELNSLRQSQFPVDGIALDLQWFGGTFNDPWNPKMGSLSFDPLHFPNPEKEVRRLIQEKGVQIMTIEESYIDERLKEFQWLLGTNASTCLLARKSEEGCDPVRLGSAQSPLWWGRGGMIDWTHPKAGELWHQMKRMKLAQLGITHHWTDLGEPEMYDPYAYYHGMEPGKNRHGDVHNLYSLKWVQSIHEGYQNPENQKKLKKSLNLTEAPRYFSMSRAGAPGIQRFGAGLWSGDIGKNAGSLRAHLNTQMHLSLAGLDYYNSDVGGFIETGSVGFEWGQSAQELYTQWFANSALGEVPLRPHSWAYSDPNATFGPNINGDEESNRQNLYLRYSLFPYIYSLAHRAHELGDPIFPPLVYEFQSDLNVRKIGNVKMIGESLLYGVVVGFGQKERSVYLPKGKWLNYHTHEWYFGEGKESSPIPLYLERNGHAQVFTLPLFMREGGIVPKYVVKNTGFVQNLSELTQSEGDKVTLSLQIVAGETPTQFNLYEDDGVSLGYLQGKMRVVQISQRMEKTGDHWKELITFDPVHLGYQSPKKLRGYEIELYVDHQNVKGVEINSKEMPRCISPTDPEIRGTASCWRQISPNLIKFDLKSLTFDDRHDLVILLESSDA